MCEEEMEVRYDPNDEEYCWNDFINWCNENGVGIEYKEDWLPWWECWCEGILASQKQRNEP